VVLTSLIFFRIKLLNPDELLPKGVEDLSYLLSL